LSRDKKQEVRQYPDFLISDKKDNTTIYHILDAKYKLLETKSLNSNDIRQILVYALLFNKEYSKIPSNQKHIKKIIIYPKESKINLKDIDKIEIKIDNKKINIDSKELECENYTDNLFDSEFKLIGTNVVKII